VQVLLPAIDRSFINPPSLQRHISQRGREGGREKLGGGRDKFSQTSLNLRSPTYYDPFISHLDAMESDLVHTYHCAASTTLVFIATPG